MRGVRVCTLLYIHGWLVTPVKLTCSTKIPWSHDSGNLHNSVTKDDPPYPIAMEILISSEKEGSLDNGEQEAAS